MTPAPKQKGLDYSMSTRKAGGKDYNSLCSAVIYGSNASEKTNVIGAMDTFESIVLRGNINNHLSGSNFSFELWMVLRKKDCNDPLSHRSQYLLHINQVYGESFEDLNRFKARDAYHRCLAMTLDDVKAAIYRAEAITRNDERDGKRCFSTKDTSTTGTILHYQSMKQ